MWEPEEIVRIVLETVKTLEPTIVNEALTEIARPDGTLANAKLLTGQKAGMDLLAANLIVRFREGTE